MSALSLSARLLVFIASWPGPALGDTRCAFLDLNAKLACCMESETQRAIRDYLAFRKSTRPLTSCLAEIEAEAGRLSIKGESITIAVGAADAAAKAALGRE